MASDLSSTRGSGVTPSQADRPKLGLVGVVGMALIVAVSLVAVSPLLIAHGFLSPSARRARRSRARSQMHRRFEEAQEAEARLFRRVRGD